MRPLGRRAHLRRLLPLALLLAAVPLGAALPAAAGDGGARTSSLGPSATGDPGSRTDPPSYGEPVGGRYVRARRGVAPTPLIWNRNFADPSVVELDNGWLALATGANIPRAAAGHPAGPWIQQSPALLTLPAWALPGDVWAADLEETRGRWVLYYAAKVAGLADGARCIGAAVATSPYGPYSPASTAPLVCPPGAAAPPADDQIDGTNPAPYTLGVIDPSLFIDEDGKRYLVYKSQGKATAIRMVRLNRWGVHVPRKQLSDQLFAAGHVVENPTIVQRGDRYVMITSEHGWGSCRYRTTYRRSHDLWSWPVRAGGAVMTTESTGICGPGGADVVVSPYRRSTPDRIYFHGWTCYRGPEPCPSDFNVFAPGHPPAWRAFYGGTLRWSSDDVPSVRSWMVPQRIRR